MRIINTLKCIIALCSAVMIMSCTKENTTLPTAVSAGTANVSGTCDYDVSTTPAGWTVAFSENFDGGAVNTGNWNIWTGGAFNNELQHYQGSNLTVSGGILTISAKKEKVTGKVDPWSSRTKTFNYTSGRIESKVLYSASAATPKVRMMARIKLPSGYGMWPAFWSYGDPWPTQGEIDILEARGQEPFTYYTNYFYGTQVNNNLVTNSTSTINSGTSLQTCWHVYEVIWEQNALTFYLDGVQVDQKTGGYVAELFGKQEKIVLNLAVGGNFFSRLITRNIVTGNMQVDWVKVLTPQ
jgi:beta-glucanase (GH16 family)